MRARNYSFRIDLSQGKLRKDNSYPIALVVRKEGQRKKLYLGISASYREITKKDGPSEIKSQWNQERQRYEEDGRKELHPDRLKLNSWLDDVSRRCDDIMREFEKNSVDWTLSQFENAYLNKAKKKSVYNYFLIHIERLEKAGKTGNKICYERTLDMLTKSDKGFKKRVFPEIDLKYVNGFSDFLTKRGCKGNTQKYYLKTLRSLLNKAIKDGECSAATYPFGKYGFSIAQLSQETEKRYLPSEYIEKMKSAQLKTKPLNWCRNLFLFSYYCQGISFVDMAGLRSKNIVPGENGNYIVYRRQKTESKKTNYIRIKITDNIQALLDWFKGNSNLVDDYLLPIISKDSYKGEQLYDHIRNRYKRYNNHLKDLTDALNFKVRLSSYMARHSYAMRLKNRGVPEDVISEALGHKDLATTKIYLDSFGNDEIAKANENL